VPSEPFYLSGGTALAEYYLQHRFSDDLDFFTRDRANFASANNRVREAASAARLAISDVVVGDYSVRYRLDGDVVTDHQLQKVEFLYDPAPYQRDPSRIGAALVDSLLCIAIKKVDALHNRTEIKDFIDFYLAVQKGGYSVTDLIAVAKAKNGAIDEWAVAAQFDSFDSLMPLDDFKRLYMKSEISVDAISEFYRTWAGRVFEAFGNRRQPS